MGFKPEHFTFDVESSKRQHESIDDCVPALVLNLEDLGIGFLVCMIPLALSLVAFILELVMPQKKAILIIIRDSLMLLYVRQVFADTKMGLK